MIIPEKGDDSTSDPLVELLELVEIETFDGKGLGLGEELERGLELVGAIEAIDFLEDGAAHRVGVLGVFVDLLGGELDSGLVLF